MAASGQPVPRGAAPDEPPFDPAQVIVDAHHHLYDRLNLRYLTGELLADLEGGHDVRATVFVQARAGYRSEGPDALRPVGETEFAVAAAREGSDKGHPGVAAAIVACADLTLGADVAPVLEAHVAAGGGRVRGIRHILAWNREINLLNPSYPTTVGMMESDAFLAGFGQLAPLGLSFDAWLHFDQLPRLIALARRFPTTSIILDHCGGILGIGPYAGRQEDVRAAWSREIDELAKCPNVSIKLSGLGMALTGLQPEPGDEPLSARLSQAWRPWMLHCIEAFGCERAMFASNSPAEKESHGYTVGWNAMQRLCAGASPSERDALFRRSAASIYRLEPALVGLADPVSRNAKGPISG